MARKNQKLINYHTGKKAEMPKLNEVDYGEIVVRHNAEAPELLIKISEDSFGVFQASGAVKTAIDSAVSAAKTELNGDISDLQSDINSLSSATKTLIDEVSAATKATYATKTELEATSGSIITAYTNAIAAAKKDVYDSATSFTTKEVSTLSTTISGVRSDLNELSGVVKSISTNIENNYVTTGNLDTTLVTLRGEISAAQKGATDASSAYTDTQIAAAKEYSDGKLSAATETLKQSIKDVDEKVDTLSGDVHTTITNVQTELTQTINEKVATAYRFQGSCTYADLANKEKVNGYVWNVTDAHDNVPEGTNYAWSEKENKWDALGGTVDLSPYAKTEDVNKKIETINQTNTNLQSAIDSVSSATKTLINEVSAATKANYATKTELQTAQNNITNAYTKAITDAKAEVYTSATTFANNAVTAATATLNQSIQDVDGRVTDLSGVTKTVKATADSAVQTASIVDSATCKVSVNKVDTELQFNFENLVVDCGEF